MPHVQENELAKLDQLARLVLFVREEMSPKTTLGELMTFLMIATDSGLTVTEISRDTGISVTTLKNALDNLGPEGRTTGRGEGFSLVEGYKDVNDRRNTRYKLTGKGLRFAKELTKRVGGVGDALSAHDKG